MTRPFPPAYPHGELENVFDDVWFVTGTIKMGGPLPVRFSRNMTVVRNGGELTLINSLRLDDAGLEALDALGDVKHVIRLAGFHGMDDPFYKDRYGATVWAVKGMIYAAGFKNPKATPADAYFQPDVEMDAETALPIDGARLISVDCLAGEGLVHLSREGGILVSGDSLQNWAAPDVYFSRLGKLMMRLMGFIRPYQVGPGWLKQSKPERDQIRALLDLEFAHLLPAHGTPVIGEAKEKLRPSIERL